MNGILLYLLIGLSLGDSIQGPPADAAEYYNDSVRLHDVYNYQINYLKNLRETDTAEWNRKALHDHLVTCAMQKNLTKHNNVEYTPTDSFLRKGCETAYAYPKPSEINHIGGNIPTGSKLHCIVYDKQTRFFIKPNGQTRIPYITKITFDKGRALPAIEKLDPVTFEKLNE